MSDLQEDLWRENGELSARKYAGHKGSMAKQDSIPVGCVLTDRRSSPYSRETMDVIPIPPPPERDMGSEIHSPPPRKKDLVVPRPVDQSKHYFPATSLAVGNNW